MWYDEKTQYQSLKKVRILKTERGNKGGPGFCMEHEPNNWFDNVDKLVIASRNDPESGMKTPFDVSSIQLERMVSSKSLNREGSQSSPDIRGQGNHFQPKPMPNRLSVKLGETRVSSRSLTVLNVENTHPILHNKPDVRKLLFDKPFGTYVIHQGNENTEFKPYDIYVNEKSTPQKGIIKVKKMYVYKDQRDGSYMLGNDQSLKYESLNDLVSRNKSKFIHPLEDNSDGSKPHQQHNRPPVDAKVEYLDFNKHRER
jgi:hypothetical protein